MRESCSNWNVSETMQTVFGKKGEQNDAWLTITITAGACLVAAVLFFIIYGSCLNAQEIEQPRVVLNGIWIEHGMKAGLTACVCLAVFHRKRQDRQQVILLCLMLMGMIMRIGYMLYTPYALRSHDVLMACGHADYIKELIAGHLPMTNNYQFYHPPLFHVLAAGMALTFGKLTGIREIPVLLEAGKLVSCWASILTLGIFRELCRELNLGKTGTLIAISLTAFLPEHYLLAGRLNNDSLSVMFMAGVLLFTLRWWLTRSLKDLMILALCYGLGIMTKVSVGTFSVITGAIMLHVLYLNIKEGTGKRCFFHYMVFAGIAFPLALWYPVRNLVLFGQPFTYVFPIEPGSPGYVGNISLLARFLPRFDNYIYADPYRDYNVWTYIVRTSVFGEFKYDIPLWIPQVLQVCAGILAIVSLLAIAHVFAFNRRYEEQLQSAMSQDKVLALCWAITIIFYIWFNIRYPFGCTMDFRYVVPTAMIGSLLIGRWADLRGNGIIQEYETYMLWILTGMFSITSCLMYVMI